MTASVCGPPAKLAKRESCAEFAVCMSMWKGVVKVTVFPLTEATSMVCPTGRFCRVNQPRESSVGRVEVAGLNLLIAGSVTSSISTISPAARPGLATSVTEEAPLTALEARSTDCTYLKNRVPITITLELAPTGDMSSFVSVGPAPRSTMPLSIRSRSSP